MIKEHANPDLPWTGERIIPEEGRYMFRRHFMAYHFALPFCCTKIVLDVGCGEGYGSHLLAGTAALVTAIDMSEEAVNHARAKYARPNLVFRKMNAAQLDFPDNTFDVVVSFQVIEHLPDPQSFLREISRVLKQLGVAIISTPNKSLHPNCVTGPFHLREYRHDEFLPLLQTAFERVDFFGVHFSGKNDARKLKLLERLPALDILGIRKIFPALRQKVMVAIERKVELEISKNNLESALDLIGVCRNKPIVTEPFVENT